MNTEELILQQLNEVKEGQYRIERMLAKKMVPAKWISREEAMERLNCKDTKLAELRNQGKIISNQTAGPRKKTMYLAESIEKYLNNPGR